jgi:hypothetical protein
MTPVQRTLYRVARHGPFMTLLGFGVLWLSIELQPYGVLPLGTIVAMAIFLAPIAIRLKELRDGL